MTWSILAAIICVCFDKFTEQAFLPCGHLCMCTVCLTEYLNRFYNQNPKCPVCNEVCDNISRIFMSGNCRLLTNHDIDYLISENNSQKDRITKLNKKIEQLETRLS